MNITSHPRMFCIALAPLFICGSSALGADWYVDDSHTSSPWDGTEWSKSFRYLQDAIDCAQAGDVIHVAQGAYLPDKDGDASCSPSHTVGLRSESFKLKSQVAILGGYVGYNSIDPPPDTRDPDLYDDTILSGNIGSTGTTNDNSYHVVQATGVDDQAELNGFMIRDGNANSLIEATRAKGGGIYISGINSSPQIRNCKITANQAHPTPTSGNGGGVHMEGQAGIAPTFDNCIFSSNSSHWGPGIYSTSSSTVIQDCLFEANSGGYCGALHLGGATPPPKVTNCVFRLNTQSATGSGGGAIHISASSCTLRSCTFDTNSAVGAGGAVWSDGSAHTPVVVDCLFTNNMSGASPAGGGGFYIATSSGSHTFVNVRWLGNSAPDGDGGGLYCDADIPLLSLTNCLFAGNTAFKGAALRTKVQSPNSTLLTNCTIAANSTLTTAEHAVGGLYYENGASTTVVNSILYGNVDGTDTGASAQIGPGTSATVSYCDVQGGFSGTANINADPKFLDVGTLNYRLLRCSPCVDIGSNAALSVSQDPGDLNTNSITTEPTPLDLDLHDRIIDDAYVATFTDVDMGAYENSSATPCSVEGDVNSDTMVNGQDIEEFLPCLLSPLFATGACHCADMNGDGVVKADDLPCFINKLLFPESTCNGDCVSFQLTVPDCNANGEHDANDIAWHTSADCNGNGIPDECDLDAGDPDGNELVSTDENENGIPDECDVDCNNNDVPDDIDIAQATSNDVNSNSIPDDWDIHESTSADCNLDGIPDECAPDCNGNGVPDDCDVNPADPDGDEWVSPDCNGNGMPDECDLTLTLLGSLDCNENGIPDECDIADETSLDENENGIPDECEEGERSAPSGGRGGLAGESTADDDGIADGTTEAGRAAPIATEAERLAAFYEWCIRADFAGLSQRERYDAIMAELESHGLPKAWPPWR